jgi:hypothetical protein
MVPITEYRMDRNMSSATERTSESSSTTRMVSVDVSVGDDAELVMAPPFHGVFLALRFAAAWPG